jgi:DNA repair exonuclease SbcCD ATPase subunit
MMQRQPDERFIDALVADSNSRELSELETRLLLVQSACALALEGNTRASASEVAAKALKDYKLEAAPYFIGQTFSYLKITSVTTHGKNRFVLDAKQLEKIRQDLESRVKESMEKLQASTDKFKDLPEKIESLQKEWKQTSELRAKERELVRLINADRLNPPRLDYWQAEYRKVQQRDDFISRVKKQVKSLEQKEKKLPSLKEKKEALQAKIAEHEKKVSDLAEKEKDIAAREQALIEKGKKLERKEEGLADNIIRLQKRTGWVELAEMEQGIEASRKELDSLARQLGEKRSLLDRMLGRNKGGISG